MTLNNSPGRYLNIHKLNAKNENNKEMWKEDQ